MKNSEKNQASRKCLINQKNTLHLDGLSLFIVESIEHTRTHDYICHYAISYSNLEGFGFDGRITKIIYTGVPRANPKPYDMFMYTIATLL